MWAVLPRKGLFLRECFSCHTFGAFSVVQWRASENYKFSDILIVCLLVHAFIDLFLPSSKSRNYLGKKGISRQKEQGIRVMRGLAVWGQLGMARVGEKGVLID